MSVNFDAPASIHKWSSLEKKQAGDAAVFGSIQKWDGTLADCIKRFMSKRGADQQLYDIMVGEEAGTGKTILEPADIRALAAHPDFPNALGRPRDRA